MKRTATLISGECANVTGGVISSQPCGASDAHMTSDRPGSTSLSAAEAGWVRVELVKTHELERQYGFKYLKDRIEIGFKYCTNMPFFQNFNSHHYTEVGSSIHPNHPIHSPYYTVEPPPASSRPSSHLLCLNSPPATDG